MTALAAIWLSKALMAAFAPDMVTGSQHERLPIATLTVWIWAALPTVFVVMVTRRKAASSEGWSPVPWWSGRSPLSRRWWLGTDPTRMPLAVFIVPMLAAFATGLIAVHQALE